MSGIFQLPINKKENIENGFVSRQASSGRRLFGEERRRVLLSGIVFICIILFLQYSGIGGAGDRALFDYLLKLRVNEKQASDKWSGRIFSVDLNDRGEKALENLFANSEAFTETIKVLNSRDSMVVLDYLFPYKTGEDGEFLKAIENSPNIILAVRAIDKNLINSESTHSDLTDYEKKLPRDQFWNIRIRGKGEDAIPEAGAFYMSYNELILSMKKANGQLGFTNMEPKHGKYRQIPLLYKYKLNEEGGGYGYLPSLVLAAAVKYLKVKSNEIEFYPGERLTLPLPNGGAINIPVDNRAYINIPFISTWKGNEYRRYMHELALNQSDKNFENKINVFRDNSIAFLADLTSNQKDIGIVPFEDVYPLSQIHISALESIIVNERRNNFIYDPPPLLPFFLSVCLLALVSLISSRRKIWQHSLLSGLLFAFFTAGIFLLWKTKHIIPWYTAPALAVFLAWLAAFIYQFITVYGERQRLKDALSEYFAPGMTGKIIKEGIDKLSPQYKTVSILFSDIANFTYWSRNRKAQDVYNFLNAYHKAMEEIVFAHGGTVDKFLGDGMLGLFGAPYELSDHPLACLKAAFDMQKRIRELSKKWEKEFKFEDMKVRIGINCGKVFTGNLGRKTRIDYSVFGSAVNLAQRMEINAPKGGILGTKQLWKEIKKEDRDQFPKGREGVLTKIKGYKDKPIKVICFRLK